MPEVLDRLHKEHADLSRLLDALERQLDMFSAGQPVDYDIMGSILRYCLEYPDAVHHPKEDLIYGLVRVRDPGLAAAVGDLEEDHRRLASATRELAELIDRAHADVPVNRNHVHRLSRDFVSRYRTHIRREETQMFPAARRVLTDEDWAEVDRQLQGKADPLFGGAVARYFRRLRDDIDAVTETPDAQD